MINTTWCEIYRWYAHKHNKVKYTDGIDVLMEAVGCSWCYDFMGFYVLGVIGAAAYIATLFLTGNLKSIRSQDAPLKVVIFIFMAVGGLVTALYELSLNKPLVLTMWWSVFLLGFGWQGLISNFTTAKKAAESEEARGMATQAEKELQKYKDK
jgi:hypothetical protein